MVLWILLLPARGWTQTNDDINSGVQFNFSTPGARSLALGGAFLALADDATAAYTNPAGLTNLTVGGSEVSFELRQWRFSNAAPDLGHSFGSPSGFGLDTVAGLQFGETETGTGGLSFVSFGYVLPGGWIVSLYRHELAHFKGAIESQGPFLGEPQPRPSGGFRQIDRIFPFRSSLQLDIVNYGVSGAREILIPARLGSLSLGAGVSFYQLDLQSRTERFYRFEQDRDGDGQTTPEELALGRQPGGFFGYADTLGDNVFNTQVQTGDSHDWGINLGALWKIGDGKWSLGTVYRRGPELAMKSVYFWGPAAERYNMNHPPAGSINPIAGGPGVLKVPDVLGLGAAWSGREGTVKVTLDYDRVLYSQLAERMTNILSNEADTFQAKSYSLEDAGEVHLGLEYVFLVLESKLVATFRAGAWYDPDHTLRYTGPNDRLRVRFPGGEDETHACVGLGFVVQENFQVDLAVDSSDRFDTLSISLVKFF
jgi:long-chain fatty acid transport protein